MAIWLMVCSRNGWVAQFFRVASYLGKSSSKRSRAAWKVSGLISVMVFMV